MFGAKEKNAKMRSSKTVAGLHVNTMGQNLIRNWKFIMYQHLPY